MTTDHHTPIPASPKQAANAATFNSPLAELDAEISNRATAASVGTLASLTTKSQSDLVTAINEALGWGQAGYFVRGNVTWNPSTKILSFANRAYIIHGYTGGATYTAFQTSSGTAPFTIDFSGVSSNSYAFAYVTGVTNTTTQTINSTSIVIGDWTSIAASVRTGSVFVLAAYTNHTKEQIHSPFVLAQMETDSLLQKDTTLIGGNNYEVVAGVLRETSGVWDFISTSNHTFKPDDATVTQVDGGSGYVQFNYGKTYTNVISFVAAPDDTFVQNQYYFGSSVGTADAKIHIYRRERVYGYIYFDGADWQSTGDSGISGLSYNSGTGVLTITHDDVGSANTDLSVTPAGAYIPVVNAIASTATDVVFRDITSSGAVVTGAASTTMKLYFTRESYYRVNPASTMPTGSNIWCIGIFEL